MTSPVVTALVLVAAPVAASVVGSTIAARRRFAASTISSLQHLAAGIVTAAVAGEVLPDLRDRHSLGATIVGFVAGVAVVMLLSDVERRTDLAAGSAGLPTAMIAIFGIDLFIDGLLVGVGAALGEGQGRVLTIALTFEILFLALSLVGELKERGLTARRASLVSIACSIATIAGAVLVQWCSPMPALLCRQRCLRSVRQPCSTSSPRSCSPRPTALLTAGDTSCCTSLGS